MVNIQKRLFLLMIICCSVNWMRTLFRFRCILLSFDTVSSLNINIAESELLRLGDGRDANRLDRILGCRSVDLPMKYLGLPLGVNDKGPLGLFGVF